MHGRDDMCILHQRTIVNDDSFTAVGENCCQGRPVKYIVLVERRADLPPETGIVAQGDVNGAEYLFGLQHVVRARCLVVGADAQFGDVAAVGVFGKAGFKSGPEAVTPFNP